MAEIRFENTEDQLVADFVKGLKGKSFDDLIAIRDEQEAKTCNSNIPKKHREIARKRLKAVQDKINTESSGQSTTEQSNDQEKTYDSGLVEILNSEYITNSVILATKYLRFLPSNISYLSPSEAIKMYDSIKQIDRHIRQYTRSVIWDGDSAFGKEVLKLLEDLSAKAIEINNHIKTFENKSIVEQSNGYGTKNTHERPKSIISRLFQ